MSPWSPDWLFVGVAVGAVGVGAAIFLFFLSRSWRYATFSGVPIGMPAVIGMRLRGTPVPLIVEAGVMLAKRDRAVVWGMIEAVYLAQGRPGLTAHELAE